MIFLYIFSILSWASKRPSVQITNIEISGLHAADETTVGAIVKEELSHHFLYGLLRRDNIFLYPKDTILERMRSTTGWIQNVTFQESLHVLRIHITERSPAYLWCAGLASATSTVEDGTCYFADESGYIFAQAPGISGFPYLRIVSEIGMQLDQPYGTSTLTTTEFVRTMNFLHLLRKEGYQPIVLEQMGEHDYRVTTNAPWKLLWESDSDPQHVILNLKVALDDIAGQKREQPIREIDVRFGDKVFYR